MFFVTGFYFNVLQKYPSPAYNIRPATVSELESSFISQHPQKDVKQLKISDSSWIYK